MTTQSLQDQVALITGSTSGIGLAMATTFKCQGANVVMHGSSAITDAKVIEALEKLNSIPQGSCHYIQSDLKEPTQGGSVVEQTVDHYGKIDILVLNAGMQRTHQIKDFPKQDYLDIMNVHLHSAFFATQAALPHMQEQRKGRIIYMGSAHASVASLNKSAYVSAKHGLYGLMKTTTLEGAPYGITANMISPGFVQTELVENQIQKCMTDHKKPREQAIADHILTKHVVKEFVTEEAIAQQALLICSPAFAAVSGSNFQMDAGWTCH